MGEPDQLRFWRDAATLIIAGKVSDSADRDYKVLMLERSKTSSFFPGAYVFSGGEISPADCSEEWSTIFHNVVSQTTDDVMRDLRVPGARPPIVSSAVRAGNPNDRKLDASLAFRICAIRETFEESGLLLATKKPGSRDCLTQSSDVQSHVKGRDFQLWRDKVHKNPWNFLALCRELQVVPNVWALREWSNWLTPVMRQVPGPSAKPHRFDTIFYTCFLDHIPSAFQDSKEITSVRWIVPKDVVGQTLSNKLRGPQGYELSRLANFSLLKDLANYTYQREPLGLEQWLPVLVGCKNGLTSLMPGDGIYPNEPDKYGTKKVEYRDTTVEEMRSCARHLHRIEQVSHGNIRFICNIKLTCGQIRPIQYQSSSY